MSSEFDNVKPMILAIGELKERIKEMEAKVKEYEEIVRPALAGKGKRQFDDFVIEVKTVPGRKTLDKEAVAAVLGDLDPYYKEGAPFSTLKIERIQVEA